MAGSQASLKRFYGVVLVLAIAGIGVLWWSSRTPPAPSVPVAVAIQPADTAGFQGYVLGVDSAPVTVTEFADYQCPACQTFDMVQFPSVRERLITTGKIRFVYKDFPLDQHPWARLAAHAAACADDQEKFWELHEAIYRTQPAWSGSRNAGGHFRDLARNLGVELGPYDACMSDLRYAGRIQASAEEGTRLGVHSTPTFVIGGRLHPGVMGYDQLRALVDSITDAP